MTALGLISLTEAQFFDVPRYRAKDLYSDEEAQSISEIIEEAESEEHPILRASRI